MATFRHRQETSILKGRKKYILKLNFKVLNFEHQKGRENEYRYFGNLEFVRLYILFI